MQAASLSDFIKNINAAWEAATAVALEKAKAKAARRAEQDPTRHHAAAKDAAAAEGTALAKTPRDGKRRAEEGEESDSALKRRNGMQGANTPTTLGPEAFRAAHQIVADSRCPDPMETFDAAAPALGPALTRALRALGYVAPTPIQAQAWPAVLQGRDLIAVAKTGSGKTFGFLLPALVRVAERSPQHASGSKPCAKPTCLVLAPTRELVQQIAGEAEKVAHTVRAQVLVVFGGVPKNEQVSNAKQGADVVIATPGRLMDLAAGAPSKNLLPVVSLEDVNYLVLDEADRMLDMGFEPDIRKIAEQCKASGRPEEGGCAPGAHGGSKRQTLFFTATWAMDVQRTARSLASHDALTISVGQGAGGATLSANPLVRQTVFLLEEKEKLPKLHEVLSAELGQGQTCLIFVATKAGCDRLEREVRQHDYGFGERPWCRALHADREQWEREESLQQFRDATAGQLGQQRAVLVATDVAARGLDVPGVAVVVVHDSEGEAAAGAQTFGAYVHRIGRTGRAGRQGRAFALFTPGDPGAAELVQLLEGAGQAVPSRLRDLAGAEWYREAEREGLQRWEKNRRAKEGKARAKAARALR
ncbi:unnamed protein product [Prorocentrum cordatum]|uniref:RNA helicase n=1 Tax=Prorocentrum cordatum TaxID=2364126 RepID=A0ABN9X2E8_9DINO|nr:unnamed protein product [Polarella glacialis]